MTSKKTEVRSIRPPTIEQLASAAKFPTLEDIVAEAFQEMRPANRMSVTEAAQAFTKIGSGGGHSRPWSIEKTPYLEEPQNVLTSLEFTGMVFLGPARTGKTVMGLNWVSHTVKTDPADMLYVHMDRENARKWSNGDLNRYLLSSTAIRAEQLTSRQHDNTFDKAFKSGMRFLLTYPTASNLSGITVGRVGFIDYDRMDDDVDGEGNPYDLGAMRTTTFGRFAMTYAESSPNPNKEIQDPRWMPTTPHQAPPIRGIFELYNRGDRRMFYWKCPECGEWFLPKFTCLDWGGVTDPMDAREAVVMICPNHGCVIQPRHKDILNRGGRWLRDGERLTADDQLVAGEKVARSSIASFWLLGPQAAYQSWGQLVEKYLRALTALEETGDDGPLRKTVTTDQGMYYIAPGRLSDLSPEMLKQQAEDWGSTAENPTVPHGVRFLIATCDVQKTAFVVQVHGFSDNGDMVIIDSFKLRLSNRVNSNGDRLPIEPHAYAEDWQVLREVMDRSYELADGSGRRMRIRATGVDSGGAEGVTGHAYNFWRGLKMKKTGEHRKVILIKGGSTPGAPEARTIWPDSAQKDRFAVAKGDVPVLILNSNKLKDRVQLLLNRRVRATVSDDENGGMMRYSDWLEDWFYKQFTSEIRTEKGWENTKKKRNEVFDLAYYAQGIALRPTEKDSPFLHFGVDRLRWDETIWALDWDRNDLVFATVTEATSPSSQYDRPKVSLSDLGKKLG